jgi:hypothetical protein
MSDSHPRLRGSSQHIYGMALVDSTLPWPAAARPHSHVAGVIVASSACLLVFVLTMSHLTKDDLLGSAKRLFSDLASNAGSTALLSHFSSNHQITLRHCATEDMVDGQGNNATFPLTSTRSPCTSTYVLTGHNAVRSYFDMICTHWTRSRVEVHHTSYSLPKYPNRPPQVVIDFSITWTWNRSGHSWTEDCTMTIDFDDSAKMVNMLCQTTSGRETCVMHATDPRQQTQVSANRTSNNRSVRHRPSVWGLVSYACSCFPDAPLTSHLFSNSCERWVSLDSALASLSTLSCYGIHFLYL